MQKHWNTIIRIAAIGLAMAVELFGAQLSIDGFNFKLPAYKGWGIVLAVCVPILELVFVEEGSEHDTMMVVFGIGAYGYYIFTNFIGITAAQMLTNWFSDPGTIAFDLFLAFMVALLPELAFKWGLGLKGKDLVTKMKGQFASGQSNPGQIPQGGGHHGEPSKAPQVSFAAPATPRVSPGDLKFDPRIAMSKNNGNGNIPIRR